MDRSGIGIAVPGPMNGSPAALLTLLLLCAGAAFAALAFGGSEPWARGIFECAVLLIGAAWALRMVARPYPIAWNGMAATLASAALLAGLQILSGRTEYVYATSRAAIEWMARLAVFFLALQIFQSGFLRTIFLRFGMFLATFLAVLGILQQLTSATKIYWVFPSSTQLWYSSFVNRNHYAAFAIIGLGIALHTLFDRSFHGFRWVPVVSAAAIYASLISCGSRAGAVLGTATVAAGLLKVGLAPASDRSGQDGRRRRRRLLAVATAMLCIALAVVVAVGGSAILGERLAVSPLVGFRGDIYHAGWDMITDRPWLGFGFGTFDAVYPAYARTDAGVRVNYAHNDWLQWSAEAGLPFGMLLVAAFVWACWQCRRVLWAYGLIAVTIHACFDFVFHIPAVYAFYFLTLASLAWETGWIRETNWGVRLTKRRVFAVSGPSAKRLLLGLRRYQSPFRLPPGC